MLRYLIRNFQRDMVSNTGVFNGVQSQQTQLEKLFLAARFITNATNENPPFDPSKETNPLEYLENDSAYLIPYDFQAETDVKLAQRFNEHIKQRLRLNKNDLQKVLNDTAIMRTHKRRNLTKIIDKLMNYGVTKETILEIPWILVVDLLTLDKKIELIKRLKPKDINHFVPFLRLSTDRLQKLITYLTAEMEVIPEGNRVYYISEKLKVDPIIVSKYLCRRLFILEMSFDLMAENLKNMLDFNVLSEDLLSDLWAMRYNTKSAKNRFERAKSGKKEKIMPWMVRCPEPVLENSIKRTTTELEILGDRPSVVEYIAERLKFDVDFTRGVMEKHPASLKVRVTKVKTILDFLLDEAGFTRYEIAQNPRILCHGLKTTKHRLEELKSIGCRPSTLVILCRSKREFQKFIDEWLQKNPSKSSQESS